METDAAKQDITSYFTTYKQYTTMARFLSFLSLLLVLESSNAWVARIDGRTRFYGRATQLYAQIESPNVKGLDNHEDEGELIAKSIAAWLDSEWTPQEVHIQMGKSAKTSYIGCRESGEDEIMDIMMKVADDLEGNWKAYDADAFVNPWDIANYVSDYLSERSGEEGCDCNAKIY